MTDPHPLVDTAKILDIVERAGAAILQVYETDFEIQNKADESPLTQADLAAHRIIVAGLQDMTPDIPIISEESEPPGYEQRREWQRYWLVDPLDGTKEFVNRNGEFTVNIALIEAGVPTFGIVGVPVQQRTYVGDGVAGRAQVYFQGQASPIAVKRLSNPPQSLTVVASRSHGGERLEHYLDALAQQVEHLQRQPVGSSLKFCVLATGDADFYPRLGPTSEWDIAAAHAVLRAAGGEVYDFAGNVFRYNTKASLLNSDFMAVGDNNFDWLAWLPDYPAEEG